MKDIIERGLTPEKIAIEAEGSTLTLAWPAISSMRAATHTSIFDAKWLWKHCGDRHGGIKNHEHQIANAREKTIPGRTEAVPWAPTDLTGSISPSCTWDELDGDGNGNKGESHALACLRDLRKHGFCVINKTPTTVDATAGIAERLGRLQPTLYGNGVWDTAPRIQEEVRDTAYSNVELPLHTDCTYLQHTPGVQLFVCEEQAAAREGSPLDGATRLADGFKVAEVLRRDHPATFAFFCRLAIPFVHAEGDVRMEHLAPVFELHPDTSEVVSFRYNELDRATLGATFSFDDIRDYYEHQAVLVSVISSLEMSLRLERGDAILVDNHRVLHGRHSFVGQRNMIGCYMTADDWKSRLRVLEEIECAERM